MTGDNSAEAVETGALATVSTASTGGVGLPASFRVVLDAGARRLDGGRVLLGGSPLRLYRLSMSGSAVLDRLQEGATVGESGAGASRLARRLCTAGAAHPRPPTPGSLGPPEVAVVVPVRDRADGLARTLAALGPVGQVVVVDDGSLDDSADVAERAGATVVRRASPGGPAAARNAGLGHSARPVIAFVDSDVVPEPGWLDAVLPHFDDPLVGAVGPRVGGVATAPSALARYEAVRSPLDLGPAAGQVSPRGRVPYVPAAALLVRREALDAVGPFDEAMPVGEDVDLVWRLAAVGWVVRYEPAGRVAHEHRTRLSATLSRRLAYGSSAAPLARRHPSALVPLQVSVWSLASWTLVGLGWPVAGAVVAAVTTALLPRKLSALDHPWREAARLAGSGHLAAGRLIADAVMRAWLPPALTAAFVSRRARRALLLCATVPALIEWRTRHPGLDPLRFTGLRFLDDAAYCAGVWAGCLTHRTMAPLVPDLSNWPGRRAAVAL